MDSFSIVEAAALIAGHPPSSYKYNEGYNGEFIWYLDGTAEEQEVFDMAKSSIKRAVESDKLPARVIGNPSRTWAYKDEEDWKLMADLNEFETSIDREDLINWLKDRGCYPDFFFPENEVMDFMNPDHEHYSPKLAATVAAWEAANQAKQNRPAEGKNIDGKTVKAWAIEWLQENAARYRVLNDKETITAFDQMAGIMNWETTGGRSKKVVEVKDTSPTNSSTQGRSIKKTAVVSALKTEPKIHIRSDDDSDLPF